MIPDRVPGIGEHVAQRVIIRLARQHVAIGFDAHAVERGRAAFHAQVIGSGIELAVLCGRVPDQLLTVLGGLALGHIQNGLQLVLSQARSHRQAVSRVDQGIQTHGRDTQIGQKIQCAGDGVQVGVKHGGVGHHIQPASQCILQPGNGLPEGAAVSASSHRGFVRRTTPP